MGWTFPWASSFGSDFNSDFNISFSEAQQREGCIEYNYKREPEFQWRPEQEGGGQVAADQFAAMCGTDKATYRRDRPGMSAFAREAGTVYHTYSAYARGVDALWGMYPWLDRAPKGTQRTRCVVAPPRRVQKELSGVVTIHHGSSNATARGAADWLLLAATPAFTVMALLTVVLGGGASDMLCSATYGARPLSGMVPMYMLMSVFHLAPWLKLIARERCSRTAGQEQPSIQSANRFHSSTIQEGRMNVHRSA